MGCRSSQKKFQRYRPKIDIRRKIFVFDPIYKGKRAKISPKIHKIEIWPKSRPKVINFDLATGSAIFLVSKIGTFGKSGRFRTKKNGTSSDQIKILRPLL